MDHLTVTLTQLVACCWQSWACCSACGSLWTFDGGSPGVWGCAALTRGPLVGRQQREADLLWICAWGPLDLMLPSAHGQGFQAGWSREKFHWMFSRMHRLAVPLTNDLDWSPGTAAGPGTHALPQHPHSSHLLSPCDCHQPSWAQELKKPEAQILHAPFWTFKVLKLPRKRADRFTVLWRATEIWENVKNAISLDELRKTASSPKNERSLDTSS